ncbi:hypothetical protein PsorP6_007513 [Peronosclerospora sorghi]|uniref:Uncharacterized protein n=1 Tax=Peronosclerospora sorghi TaxID=230839 RepID=A0ACC0W9Z9_9STRA|nr:hypothetical protein PsorP6_007513 [Peronosclerospora sorghi]
MERSSRRERSRDPDDGDAGTGSRLRSRRIRDVRSSMADSTSDGADTDVSSAGHNLDVPSGRQRRRKKHARKAEEETQTYERQSGYEDEEEEDVDMEEEVNGSRRKRSMSNVSNQSSTSASSMTSEPMTEEQRCARLDQYMEELEQKKKMVEEGTLAEYCRRVAAFKEERNRLLQTAELHKNLQLKNGQDLYQFEVQRAHHLWQNDRQVVKEELLSRVDAVMAKLQAEMKVLSNTERTMMPDRCKTSDGNEFARMEYTEKPQASAENDKQRKAMEPEQEEGKVLEHPIMAQGISMIKRRKMDLTKTCPVDMSKLLAFEAVRLPFDDICADITTIVNDRKTTSKFMVDHLPNNGNPPFKLERRRLFCDNYVFEDGDEVHISMPLVDERYTGTISSITDEAIYIKLESGEKARIFLPHLERRRCVLKPFLRGTPSTGSLRIMGWSEYETF